MIHVIEEPTIFPLAAPELLEEGLKGLHAWLAERDPECAPNYQEEGNCRDSAALLDLVAVVHENGREISDAELLPEIAGRKCYNSFGSKMGRKGNADYLAHIAEVGHLSVLYHVHLSFVLTGVSRRVSHELIRHYVGCHRDTDGSPSQESTRFTEFLGYYVAQPGDLESEGSRDMFERAMGENYRAYCAFLHYAIQKYIADHGDKKPTGMDRKRIYEQAAGRLAQQAETSMVWTGNAVALSKLIKERAAVSADREFQRLARAWGWICLDRWPNLFKPLLNGALLGERGSA